MRLVDSLMEVVQPSLPMYKKTSPSIMWSVFFERENNSKDVWRGGPHLFCFPLHWTHRLFSLPSHPVPPYSLYLDSFSLGMMFMDCSSWKSSLQAYGMRSEDTWQDDLQKWHLKPKSAALEDGDPGPEAARRRGSLDPGAEAARRRGSRDPGAEARRGSRGQIGRAHVWTPVT